MKLPLLIFITVFAVTLAQSQKITFDTMSGETYKLILNKQFRSLLTGYSGPSVGSYASLDLSESKKVTFAPTFALGNGNLITGKISAGITDGFADIFTNSSLNTNLSIDVEYNAIGLKNKNLSGTMLILDSLERYKFIKKRREIREASTLDSVLINTGYKRREIIRKLIVDTIALDKKYHNYKKLMVDDECRKLENIHPELYLSMEQIDTLNDELDIIQVKLKIAREALRDETIAEEDWIEARDTERLLKRSEDLRPYNEKNLTVYGFRFGWFTFGAQVRNDAFKLFDPTKALPEERLTSENFISGQVRAKYSIYQWTPDKRTYFLSFGLTYNYKSNYLDLTSTDVSITTDHGEYTDTTKTLSVVEKYNAYAGQYKPYMDEVIIDADFYYFFFKRNTFAIHVYPNLKFTVGTKVPVFNAGFGILYPFMDSKDEKSIVNAELYYNFIDVTHSTKDDLRLYKQNKIGIRFSFPINFKSNPK